MKRPFCAVAAMAMLATSATAQQLEPGLSVAWETTGRTQSSRSTSTITDVEADGAFRFRYALDRGAGRTGELDQRVAARDAESATVYKAYFTSRDAVAMPGTTAMSLSRSLFRALESGQTIHFTLLAGERSEGTHIPARREAVTLRREPGAASFETVINGETASVPAIVATGTAAGKPFRMTVLDDARFPLVLASDTGGWGGRVVRIAAN